MSAVVSAESLMNQVVWRLHLPPIEVGGFLQPSYMIEATNYALEELASMLQRLYVDYYFTETVTLQTQAGVPFVSLPTSASDINGVSWHKDASTTLPLQGGLLGSGDALTTWRDRAPGYQLQGNLIVFDTAPASVNTITISYTTTESARITNLSDTVVLPLAACKQWLVNELCILVRSREQKTADEFLLERQRLEEIIKDAATMRDRTASYAVKNVSFNNLPERFRY